VLLAGQGGGENPTDFRRRAVSQRRVEMVDLPDRLRGFRARTKKSRMGGVLMEGRDSFRNVGGHQGAEKTS
jgi:hypothetical protein